MNNEYIINKNKNNYNKLLFNVSLFTELSSIYEVQVF